MARLELTEKFVCKGLFYRCRVNMHVNSKGVYAERMTMSPLRRISCPGCDKCGYLMDDMPDFVDTGQFPLIESTGYGRQPQDKRIYELTAGNERRDPLTGIVDEWDFIFTLVASEQEKKRGISN